MKLKRLFKNLEKDDSSYMNVDYVHVKRRMLSVVAIAREYDLISEEQKCDMLKNIELRIFTVEMMVDDFPSESKNKGHVTDFSEDAIHAITETEYFFHRVLALMNVQAYMTTIIYGITLY